MPREHFKTKTIGTYIDAQGQVKTAFKAQIHYQMPGPGEDKLDLKTCTGETMSIVELSHKWATPRGLIVDGKGALNFKLDKLGEGTVREQWAVSTSIGGKDVAGLPFIWLRKETGEEFLVKLNNMGAKEWNDVSDETFSGETSSLGKKYPIKVHYETIQGSRQTCTCQEQDQVKGSKNADKLRWVLLAELDKPIPPLSFELR